MNSVLSGVRDAVRTQLWPLPVVAVLAAAAGGVFLPRLDARIDEHVPGWLDDIIFGGDAGAASTLLDAISSSLITVTSLTFSLTVVTLQLASGQFSPRLLRTFTSDVFVQSTLALFLATFTYSLTTLRAVRDGEAGSGGFVPRISVTLAFVLAVLSVMGLVLFLAHLARQIRVETMLREVHKDASETVEATTRPAGERSPDDFPEAPHDAHRILARRSGFLTSLDEAALRRTAVRFGCRIRIDLHPGSSMIEGVPLGAVWFDAEPSDLRPVLEQICGAVRVGYERTAAQDVGYGLRQLVDVANKALSPGINDPTTAVHALGHISALLCRLAGREQGAVVLRNDSGSPVVWLARPTVEQLLEDSITQPRRYGKGDPFVLLRIFGLLEELAWHTHGGDLDRAIRGELHRLRATVGSGEFDQAERDRFDSAALRVSDVLGRVPNRQ